MCPLLSRCFTGCMWTFPSQLMQNKYYSKLECTLLRLLNHGLDIMKHCSEFRTKLLEFQTAVYKQHVHTAYK